MSTAANDPDALVIRPLTPERKTPSPPPNDCCDPAEQASCCAPSEKSDCCGPSRPASGARCGCR